MIRLTFREDNACMNHLPCRHFPRKGHRGLCSHILVQVHGEVQMRVSAILRHVWYHSLDSPVHRHTAGMRIVETAAICPAFCPGSAWKNSNVKIIPPFYFPEIWPRVTTCAISCSRITENLNFQDGRYAGSRYRSLLLRIGLL